MVYEVTRNGKDYQVSFELPNENEDIISQIENERGAWIKFEEVYNQRVISFTGYSSGDTSNSISSNSTNYLFNNDFSETLQATKKVDWFQGALFLFLASVPQTRDTAAKRALNTIFMNELGCLPVFNPTSLEMEFIASEAEMQPYAEAMQTAIAQVSEV